MDMPRIETGAYAKHLDARYGAPQQGAITVKIRKAPAARGRDGAEQRHARDPNKYKTQGGAHLPISDVFGTGPAEAAGSRWMHSGTATTTFFQENLSAKRTKDSSMYKAPAQHTRSRPQIHPPPVPGPSRNSLASPGSSDTWNPGNNGESSTATATTPLLPSTSCSTAPCAKVRLARAGWSEAWLFRSTDELLSKNPRRNSHGSENDGSICVNTPSFF